MFQEIAKANIEHFKKLLETEKDSLKRGTIQELLAEHERKLTELRCMASATPPDLVVR